jgi:glycosyltransferase involved in cell wall biosynthesis
VTGRAMRVVYVAYWGLLEPLGRSLIAPAVVGLAEQGVEVDLVTFEKGQDLADSASLEAMRTLVARAGIRWRPLRYHKRPRVLVKVLNLLSGVFVCVRLVLFRRASLVHARTFVGGLIGCIAAKLTLRPWVYHGEGFWPEQQVEGGVWARTSVAFRVTHTIDRWLHGQASGIVVLAHRAVPIVEAMSRVRARGTPVIVVPSCVDLDRFPRPTTTRPTSRFRLVYVGSLGGRYLIEPLGAFLEAARRLDGHAVLSVYSHSDLASISRALVQYGVPREAWRVGRARNADVPGILAESDAGLLFLASGPGSHSCSPTKIGEYWAAGLPVVCTEGLGDVDDIVRTQAVGVVLPNVGQESIREGAARLHRLLRDPDLAARCRKAADEHYALGPHVDAQLSLYRGLSPVSTSAAPERLA